MVSEAGRADRGYSDIGSSHWRTGSLHGLFDNPGLGMPGTSCILGIDLPRRCFSRRASLATESLHEVEALKQQGAPHRCSGWSRERCRRRGNPRPNHRLDHGRQDSLHWRRTSPFLPTDLSPSLTSILLNIYMVQHLHYSPVANFNNSTTHKINPYLVLELKIITTKMKT